jgi:hypothetical protein
VLPEGLQRPLYPIPWTFHLVRVQYRLGVSSRQDEVNPSDPAIEWRKATTS